MTTKSRKLLRSLLPPADKIALACGVDQQRAKKIQAQLGNLLEFVVDIIAEQAELIEGQADTVKLADEHLGRERDAGKKLDDALTLLSGNPATLDHILERVFTDFFAEEFKKLDSPIKIELFAALINAINSLKNGKDKKEPKKDGE